LPGGPGVEGGTSDGSGRMDGAAEAAAAAAVPMAMTAGGPAMAAAPMDVKPRSRKMRRKEDGKPRRSASGYQLYMSEARHGTQLSNPGVGFGAVTKILGAQWTAMSEAEKKPYLDQAKVLREDYEVALAHWEEDQRSRAAETEAAPRRMASQAAGDGKAPAKRRRMGQYSGLGNLAADENDDLTCKLCGVRFGSVTEKREHLLSRSHQEAATEADQAQPARDIALTIPIFTDEFVEHYDRREKALKVLRQESDQLVRNNSIMVEQIEKLKASITESKQATAKLNETNAELLQDATDLKASICDAFREVPLVAFPAGPQPEESSIDTYLQSLAAMLGSDSVMDPELRQKAVAAAAMVEQQWNETVRAPTAAIPPGDPLLA